MDRIIVFFVSLNESEDFIALLKEEQFSFQVSPRTSDEFERLEVILNDMDKMVYLFYDWFAGNLGYVKFGGLDYQNKFHYKTTVCGGSYNETEYMLLGCVNLQILERTPTAFIQHPAPDVYFKGKYFLLLGHFLGSTQAKYGSLIEQCGGTVKRVGYFMGGADYVVFGDKTLQNWQRKNFSHNLFTAVTLQDKGKLAIISESHCSSFLKCNV